jgi:hypothetical protein
MKNSIEDFPHVLNKLTALWGFTECGEYLDSLIYDKRIGRNGFPYEAATDVMLMCYVHDDLFPKQRDIWAA